MSRSGQSLQQRRPKQKHRNENHSGSRGMSNVLFEILLGLFYGMLLTWGFHFLPREKWQIFASVPLVKDTSGRWMGLNLTYYGILMATACALGTAVLLVLMGSLRVPTTGTLALIGVMLSI